LEIILKFYGKKKILALHLVKMYTIQIRIRQNDATGTQALLIPVANFCCEYLREFSKKFETALMGYSGTWAKLIHEKT
jgi:hypothetical protein